MCRNSLYGNKPYVIISHRGHVSTLHQTIRWAKSLEESALFLVIKVALVIWLVLMELIGSFGFDEATRGFDVEWFKLSVFRFPLSKPHHFSPDAVANEQLYLWNPKLLQSGIRTKPNRNTTMHPLSLLLLWKDEDFLNTCVGSHKG